MSTEFAPRKHTPPGHVPPYDAYEAKYPAGQAPIPAAFIGIQQRDGDADAARAGLERLFGGAAGPVRVERGWHDDTPGTRTHVYWAYWKSDRDFARWQRGGFADWLHPGDGQPGPVGRFIETARVPPSRLDTLLASDTEYHGIAKLSERVEKTAYHGYWGGTRDRIVDSAHDPLTNPEDGAMPDAPRVQARSGQTVSVVMPANVCVARGGPNWSAAVGEEREIFLEQVYPAFVAGAHYLRDNPQEAGCISACLVQEVDADGAPIERVNMHAYFLSLADLERWTRSHPTHLEIFGRYLKMVRRLGKLPAINLYHEVSVIPQGGLTGSYVDCHPTTGFMRFGSQDRVPATDPDT